jgi:hypothetical protein
VLRSIKGEKGYRIGSRLLWRIRAWFSLKTFSFLFPRAKHVDIERIFLKQKPVLEWLCTHQGLLLIYNFTCLMLTCKKCNKLVDVLNFHHECDGWLEQVEEKYNEWFKKDKNGD